MSGILQSVVTSFISVRPTTIGQSFGGGYYAGQISTTGGVATHYLIVAPVASGENPSLRYQAFGGGTPPSSDIDGPTNSSQMNSSQYPAAQFCEGRSIGGFDDWYMPAKAEMEVCYYNLKPTTQVNSTNHGTNAYAVPARGSNYTSGTPAQTSATDFKNTGSQAFAVDNYWTSTGFSTQGPFAWVQYFGMGIQSTPFRSGYYRVRAVRRVAV
jgi:hypothetical protein